MLWLRRFQFDTRIGPGYPALLLVWGPRLGDDASSISRMSQVPARNWMLISTIPRFERSLAPNRSRGYGSTTFRDQRDAMEAHTPLLTAHDCHLSPFPTGVALNGFLNGKTMFWVSHRVNELRCQSDAKALIVDFDVN
ncbi:hypothetical protein BT69DRAFT_244740 [Atractiella rhizophila]|nr:hypothetical protein BT69DRAFT_244740 [Atractiella rhizophila]